VKLGCGGAPVPDTGETAEVEDGETVLVGDGDGVIIVTEGTATELTKIEEITTVGAGAIDVSITV